MELLFGLPDVERKEGNCNWPRQLGLVLGGSEGRSFLTLGLWRGLVRQRPAASVATSRRPRAMLASDHRVRLDSTESRTASVRDCYLGKASESSGSDAGTRSERGVMA